MLINHHIWSYLSDFWLTPEAVMNYAEDLFQGYRHHHNRFGYYFLTYHTPSFWG